MDTLKCECGGTLRETLLDNHDFSAYAGLPVVLCDVPGLRCEACGAETLPGGVINFTLNHLAVEIIRRPGRLDADSARYLRKHLGHSQKALAEHIGIYRETVAKWECGDSDISPQHDYILRGLAIARLRDFADLWDELGAVRTEPPVRKRAAALRLRDIPQRMQAHPAYRDHLAKPAVNAAG